MSSRFSKYKLRKWSVRVRWRDRKCVVCGTRSKLEAHHINCKSYHPAKAYDLDNGVTLCRTHHTLFHVKYKGSFRMKSVRKDFYRFMAIVENIKQKVKT